MAHSIRAFVGSTDVFQHDWLHCPLASVPLAQGMHLVPITHELWEQVHEEAMTPPKKAHFRVSGWRDRERAFFLRLSSHGPVAFIETEYFGGSGNQGAIVAKHGKITFGPRVAPSGIINQALRRMEISKNGNVFDEFDAMELWRFRNNLDILRAFVRRNWLRAWFVLPESEISELERVADSVHKTVIERAPSGLYRCPPPTAEQNPVEEFLMEKCDSMHDFDLSQPDFWWVAEFFRVTRGIALVPKRRHPLAQHLRDKTDVAHTCWTPTRARLALSTLEAADDLQREFARFTPQIYDSSPPSPLADRFDDVVAFLKLFFESITSTTIGILVDV